MRKVAFYIAAAWLAACGTSTSSTGATTTSTSASSSSAHGGAASSVGPTGTGGGTGTGGKGSGGAPNCTETHGKLTFTLTLPGEIPTTDFTFDEKVDVTAVVTASTTGSFDFDTCQPGTACMGSTVGKLTYAGDGLISTVPVGAIVRLEGGWVFSGSTFPGGAGSTLAVSNVPSWGSATNPFKGSLWLAMLLGNSNWGDLAATGNLSVKAIPLVCNTGGTSGGGDCPVGGTGDWAWTFTETAHPSNTVTVYMGSPISGWKTDEATYDISDLASWAHDLCVAANTLWIARTK